MSNKITALTLVPAFLLAVFMVCPAWANPVSGPCSNCHIMHNSQGNSMVDPDGPNEKLLTTDCLGCHSSTSGSEGISSIGAPIVYNSAAPTFGNKYKDGPNQGLAGGNFYFVEHVADNRGHNIFEANPDDELSMPPSGRTILCGTGSCHSNLNIPYAGAAKTYLHGCNACTKCHMMATDTDTSAYAGSWHHMPQTKGRFAGRHYSPEEGGWVRNWWRHLATPHVSSRQVGPAGYEDPDWEYTVSATDHNDYREGPSASTYSKTYSVSGFCGGCHQSFCQSAPDEDGLFHRHPAYNVVIPDSGEYADAFGASHTYDPLVPIGQAIDPTYAGDQDPKATVELGVDKVMCLSCHRAHGSPYPDMLRWDYDEMYSGAGDGEGCFKCHTQKDGI
ncbi:MAG: cytochrome c3 family protein [Thermodesulfobacteriota bacterium]|nr:cytochrome c3 family protein [Thermodesulfobacteriota bacterium]